MDQDERRAWLAEWREQNAEARAELEKEIADRAARLPDPPDAMTEWRAAALARRASTPTHQTSDPPAIVRKVYNGAPAATQPTATVWMDAHTQRQWDCWVEAHIQREWDGRVYPMFGELARMIGGEVKAVVEPLQTEIDELKRQLAKRKRGR